MTSRLSLDFLAWILERQDNKLATMIFLDNNNVPDKYKNSIWVCLDELKNEGFVTNVSPHESSHRQKCMFDLTPKALDAFNPQEPAQHTENHFYGDINNSNIATGNDSTQTLTNALPDTPKETPWFKNPIVISAIIAGIFSIIVAYI